jgi:hypothetical protein
VGVHSQQKWNEQVVSVPKCFERLLANLGMGSCVHQHHAQQHNVTRDTTSLGVMDLDGSHGSNLCPFNIEEAVFISE